MVTVHNVHCHSDCGGAPGMGSCACCCCCSYVRPWLGQRGQFVDGRHTIVVYVLYGWLAAREAKPSGERKKTEVAIRALMRMVIEQFVIFGLEG